LAKYQLQKREKYFLMACAAFVAVVVLYFGLQGPVQAYQRSQTDAAAARQRAETARAIRDEVVRTREAYEEFRKTIAGRAGFDLWTFLYGEIQSAQLGERATLANKAGVLAAGQVDAVEVTIRGVSMEELVEFLHRVYSSEQYVVLHELAQMEPARDGQGLDCRMTFLAPKV
jgi:hypothetical protein